MANIQEKARAHLSDRLLSILSLMASMSPMEVEAIYIMVHKMAIGQAHHGHAYGGKKRWTYESLGERSDDSVYNLFALVEEMAASDTHLADLIKFREDLHIELQAKRHSVHIGPKPTGSKGKRTSNTRTGHLRKGRGGVKGHKRA